MDFINNFYGTPKGASHPFGSVTKAIGRTILVSAGLIALAGCTPSLMNPGGGATTPPPVSDPVAKAPRGAVYGTGPTRVALLLPLTATGGPGNVAKSMKNAADLAVRALGGRDITVVVKDTNTGTGADGRAKEALSEGAQLILGPLFADEVIRAGQVSRGANVPMLAFSTSTNAAASGVYLMGFLPQDEIARVVKYAARNGRKSFAALIPSNNAGVVYEALFRQAAAAAGVRVVAIERYSRDSGGTSSAAGKVAALGDQIDAVFLAEGGQVGARLADSLLGAGLQRDKIKLVGTGQFDNENLFTVSSLGGMWYAAPERSGFEDFKVSYRREFRSDPARVATVTFDAVVLAAALARQSNISNAALTTATGFDGVDGVFRLKPNGTNERGMAVWEIGEGRSVIISPAPKGF